MIFVLSAPILIEPLCDRWYSLASPVEIVVGWRGERWCYQFAKGFEFDGRSGGPLGFRRTNAMLRDMLRVSGHGAVKSWLIWCAVSVSRSWYGFPLPGDREFRNVNPTPLFWIARG